MTPTLTPWVGDEGSARIPDPDFSFSEALNVLGVLQHFLQSSRADGDAVLESAMEKLREAAHALAMEHPDEYDSAMREIEMQKRFGLGG